MIKPRSAAFLVDGSNLYASTKALGFVIDFQKLLKTYQGSLFKAFYFTALPPAHEQSTLQPLVDHLEFNGYTVIKKEIKEFETTQRLTCPNCNKLGVYHDIKIKGNMDIEIAVIAKEIAPYIDDLFLFSGDGDFRFLVEGLQRSPGLHVTVVSTIKTRPMMCADILRRQADAFIDLADLREHVERTEDQRARRNS